MKITDYRAGKLLLVTLAVLSIAPSVRMGGLSVSAEFLVIPVVICLIGFWLLLYRYHPYVWLITGFLTAITLGTSISWFSSPIVLGHSFGISNDVVSYMGKVSVLMFSMLGVLRWGNKFIHLYFNVIVYVLIGAMIVGLWQWLPLPFSDNLLTLYSRDEEQIMRHLDRTFVTRRVTGVAYMATAHGALAGFSFLVAYSLLIIRGPELSSGLLLILSFVSIYPSLSRLAMLAVIFGLLSMPFLLFRIPNYRSRSIRLGYCLISGIAGVLAIIAYKNWDMIQRLVGRWELLFVQLGEGGNRWAQIESAIDLLEWPIGWLFGVSRVGQTFLQERGLFGHIEVEFVNIVFLYGLFGFILHYGFLIWALHLMYGSIRARVDNIVLAALVATISGMIAYQVASLGYFFFREVHVGFFAWSLLGIGLGAAIGLRRR